MSSTGRGYIRHKDDYYTTPIADIRAFITCLANDGELDNIKLALDPSAGGHNNVLPPYPIILREHDLDVVTLDIRDNSLADIKADYLSYTISFSPDLIITNPPFNLSKEFALKAFSDIRPGGKVIMLQRLNWLASQRRESFWAAHPPSAIYVHPKRISFTGTGTDSVDYAHYVWGGASLGVRFVPSKLVKASY